MRKSYPEELRKKAEHLVQEQDPDKILDKYNDMREVIQELNVHQVELELQNEELLQAQIELETSRQEYIDLFDLAPVGYFAVNKNGIITKANLTFCEKIELDRKYLIGKPSMLFIDPDERDVFSKTVHEILHRGLTQTLRIKIVSRSGVAIEAILTLRLQSTNDQQKQCWITVSDVSDFELVKRSLKSSEEKFRTVFYDSGIGIAILYDRYHLILKTINPALLQMLEYQDTQMLNYSLKQFVHSVDFPIISEHLSKIFEKNKRSTSCEVRFVTAREHTIWVKLTMSEGIFCEGKNQCVILMAENINQHKNAEYELLKLTKAVEQSSASVLITDTDGNIEYVNKKFTEITGYSFEETIGLNPRILKGPNTEPEIYRNLWSLISQGKEWRGELLNRKKDGTLLWEFASISPVSNDDGKVTNYIAVKEDITERKKMEAELLEMKEKAEESSRVKSSLLANMSHEFRTPLNGILGFTRLLLEKSDDERDIDMLQKIVLSGQRLLNTLHSILELSRIESQRELEKSEMFSLQTLIIKIYEEYNDILEKKGIVLSVDTRGSDDEVTSNKHFIEAILRNLIDNAVKYTESGTIDVIYERSFRNDNELLSISVLDTGIGISKEN